MNPHVRFYAAHLGPWRAVMLRQPAALTAAGVLATLRRIAAEHGPGCAARKKGLVLGLLRAARGCEVRHVTFKP